MTSTAASKKRKVHDSLPCILVNLQACNAIFLHASWKLLNRLCRDDAVMAILLNMHIYIAAAVLVDVTRRRQCCKIYLHAQLPQNVDQHKDLQLLN